MIRNIFIISILITSICLSQENRLFYDGREWNDIRKKSNFIDEVEYKIKSSYLNGVLDGRLYGYLKTWSENPTLANEVFGEQADYLTVRETIKSLDYFYEDPLNSYIPVPSAVIIANLYGKRVPVSIIEKYIKDSRDWVNNLTLELDTLNYSKLIKDKYLKYKDKN
tara:strand:+ start:284 stop:781 length:498 start_codon:yes stop_codon:yes gene_type:complete